MKVASVGWVRMPDARLMSDGLRIDLGPLRNIEVSPWVRARDLAVMDEGVWGQPKSLTLAMPEILKKFRMLATLTEDEQGPALVTFCQDIGAPELCEHGSRASEVDCDDSCPRTATKGRAWLSIDDALKWASALDAIVGALELTHREKPFLSWQAAAINDLGACAIKLEAPSRQFNLQVQRSELTRQLFWLCRSASVTVGVEWLPRRKPEALLVGSGLLSAMLLHVAVSAGFESDATHLCSVCGTPFSPGRGLKPSDGHYCTAVACQRERKRRNTQAARKRKMAGDHA